MTPWQVQTVVNYNSFMTSEILPWKYQENPNIAWDSIKFDKTLVDLEPEQGVPRYVTVEREAHTDYMVRRGLALLVNHGFAATPGGQKVLVLSRVCFYRFMVGFHVQGGHHCRCRAGDLRSSWAPCPPPL